MRKDEFGNTCPETLGEYRQMIEFLSIGRSNAALEFLDKKIEESPNGSDEIVIASDLEMRSLLIPMLLNQTK